MYTYGRGWGLPSYPEEAEGCRREGRGSERVREGGKGQTGPEREGMGKKEGRPLL